MITGGGVVGASAVEIVVTTTLKVGLAVRADDGNSGTIFYGYSSSVSATPGNANAGTPILKGTEGFVPASHFAAGGRLFIIGSASGQNHAWRAE